MKRKFLSIAVSIAVLFAGTVMLNAQSNADLMTLFRALPEEALPFGFGDEAPAKNWEAYIDVCDEKNRYLNFRKDVAEWEMCYWNVKDGKNLILICTGFDTFFYEYNKGKVSKTEKYGIKEMKKQIQKSIALNAVDNWVQFYPPREGTSISVIINACDYMAFQWKNEKFMLLKKYPKKNSTMDDLVQGFAKALKARDIDACMQYILPSYISEQCMGMLEGRREQFLCELLGGETDGSYCCPSSFNDIKNISYQYDNDIEGMPYHFCIELKNGRSYIYYPNFETVEIHTYINATTDEVQYIPYITGEGIG